MEEKDINYLGEFDSLESVWKRYPSGGCKGDYVVIDGINIYWDDYRNLWGDPEDMGCDSIYSSKEGSLIVKGRVCLKAVPPVISEDTAIDGFIVPVYNPVSKEWIFIDSSQFGAATVTITATVNPASLSQGYIKCGEKRSDPATGELKITALKGTNVTFEFVSNNGYKVSAVNVDKAPQGEISTYTFTDIQESHTMYVWYDMAANNVSTTLYKRSDIDTEYQSMYLAVKSLILDYPNGLTQDVTIKCTKEGTDYRRNIADNRPMGEDLYSIFIKDWNLSTGYILTLDGDNKATIDGNGFGGFYIKDSCNIIIKNFKFQNIYTLEGVASPEESACVFALRATRGITCRNLYIDNISIIGQSTLSPDSLYRTRYGITVKGYDNVTVTNCSITGVSLACVRVEDAEIADISHNRISGNKQSGITGHPCMINATGREAVFFEDNDIDASTFNEAAIKLIGFNRTFVRRNKIYNSNGPIIQCQREESNMKELEISYNLMYGNLKQPLYTWDCTHLMIGDTDTFRFNNNLIHSTTSYYQEFILRSEVNVTNFINVNNVIIRKNASNFGIFMFGAGVISNITASNNVYQIGTGIFYNTSEISTSEGSNFSKVQAKGLDVTSANLDAALNILLKETGGSRYCLTTEYANLYKSLPEYVSEFDVRYMSNNPANSSAGCDNYFSTAFNEDEDTSNGYTAINLISTDSFNSLAAYETPALDSLLLQHNTRQRGKYILFTVTKDIDSGFRYVSIGRKALLELLPVIDENGEYVNDQLYNITINENL